MTFTEKKSFEARLVDIMRKTDRRN